MKVFLLALLCLLAVSGCLAVTFSVSKVFSSFPSDTALDDERAEIVAYNEVSKW
jgi:hypothetical protein